MKYPYDVQTVLHLAITVAGIGILLTCPKLRGVKWLLTFSGLGVLLQLGYYIPQLLLRNEVLTDETYTKYLKITGIPFGILGLLGSLCLLVYFVGLKAIYHTVADARVAANAAASGSHIPQPKRTTPNPVLGIVLLLCAPVMFVILGTLPDGRGIAQIIGNPTPISIAVAIGCLVAAVAAFAGKLRLK